MTIWMSYQKNNDVHVHVSVFQYIQIVFLSKYYQRRLSRKAPVIMMKRFSRNPLNVHVQPMIVPLYNDIYNVFGIHDIFQLKHNNKCLLTDFSDKDSHNVRPSESYNMLRFKSNLTVLVSVKVYGNFLKFSKGHFKILLKSYVTRLLSRHETIYIRQLFTFCPFCQCNHAMHPEEQALNIGQNQFQLCLTFTRRP